MSKKLNMSEFGDRQFFVLCAFQSVKKLLNSKILWLLEKPVYQDAVFTEVLVSLNFCLKHAQVELKQKVAFTDDVIIGKKIDDVTDLIWLFRNVACHQGSPYKFFADINNPTKQKSMFGSFYGKGTHDIDPRCESKYEDDVAFFCGTNVLYLKRHIERAFSDVLNVHDGFIPHHVLTAFNLIHQ